jgi:hypothetical protein
MTTLTTTTFDGAKALLASGPKTRTIGNNTTIEANTIDLLGREPERCILVRLHGHAIVALFPGGRVAVRDCGYVTATTYDRINQFLPWGWYATRRGGSGSLVNRNDARRNDDIVATVWVEVVE